jgi:hypothetical protein
MCLYVHLTKGRRSFNNIQLSYWFYFRMYITLYLAYAYIQANNDHCPRIVKSLLLWAHVDVAQLLWPHDDVESGGVHWIYVVYRHCLTTSLVGDLHITNVQFILGKDGSKM